MWVSVGRRSRRTLLKPTGAALREDPANNLATDADEPHFEALVLHGHPQVVDAEQVRGASLV